MQDYIGLAEKNGVTLLDQGACQFCGARTERGVHECVEIFNLGFQHIDYSNPYNHVYRFISVDAHTLQHPELHGPWNNHFHLTRQRLMFHYEVQWNYKLSPLLSDHLNGYKLGNKEEVLTPPRVLQRGNMTTTDILKNSSNETSCQELIRNWGIEVYETWHHCHEVVDVIAKGFMERNGRMLETKHNQY